MKDLGPLPYSLGIPVKRNVHGLFLSQQVYTKEMVARAGALQYLTLTRPDISYAVRKNFLHIHAPMDVHIHALESFIVYIQGTVALGFHITRTRSHARVAYTDVDWDGYPDTRRSTSRYCVYLGDNSKHQPTISRSTTEAEYRVVAYVVTEGCWLQNLLLEIQCPISKATLVFCDNVSAIYFSGDFNVLSPSNFNVLSLKKLWCFVIM
ncbi:uncharacterized mitochondrial protein AtMg00810-like [Rutidosis leptorrhynchoides]|uniref:uncharacterized mitochondrial protein AtMg00810-like n=1 Tax=Rutidosis leptorrhynchoides TaxID=125765 RepID=UPI003A99B5D4